MLPARSTGLDKDSVANVSQIVTLDKTDLTKRVGRLPKANELRAEVRGLGYSDRPIRALGGARQRLGGSQERRVPAVRDCVSGRPDVKYQTLDTVVLDRDIPADYLCKGDLGTVVETYEPDGLEVEFMTAAGRTQALVTLNVDDVRPIADDDVISVRRLRRTG
jgi:hypothetical protein